MIDVDELVAYESGELEDDAIVALFAKLIKTGLAWSLQGFYGRTAADLIESGVITPEGEVIG